ncbi:MAG TPA: ribbon-helix-helix protein, CopG family [Stellaceae bacterium]|nr:ribbon-helix-helix protein, CopG family [Stellaceae bacterium]
MFEGNAVRSNAVPISVRLPAEIIEKLDRVAAIMERPRSWVILDAVREYLADEGQEVLDIQAGIEEAERGEGVPFEEVLAELEEKVARAEARRAAR